MPQKQLVYVAGSGHSGSTLLDMCLAGHDQISSLGEVHTLSISHLLDESSLDQRYPDPHQRELARQRIQNAKEQYGIHVCSCGEPVGECCFWAKTADELRALVGSSDPNILHTHTITEARNLDLPGGGAAWEFTMPQSYRYRISINQGAMVLGSRLLWESLSHVSGEVKDYRTIINNSLILYEAVRRAHNTPIIIDSTKNAIREKGLYYGDPKHFRILYLIRDGRAVCYSRMRRQKFSMAQSARIWKQEHRKQRLVQRTIPKEKIAFVRYEDLCRNPQQELTRICNLLGIEYQPRMLDFRNQRHNLGGNPMRLRRHESEIRLDERWRHELKSEELQEFEQIAGDLNRALGYST